MRDNVIPFPCRSSRGRLHDELAEILTSAARRPAPALDESLVVRLERAVTQLERITHLEEGTR